MKSLTRLYIETLSAMFDRVAADENGNFEQAVAAVSAALANDRMIYVAGSGHSHMLAEEVFYRAGGIAAAQAILEPELMLHLGARKSTVAEREEGRAGKVLSRYPVGKGDVVVVASNSGRNAYPIELAMLASTRGATVIAITSMQTAATVSSRHKSGKLLKDVADIVLDNQVPAGDATVTIPSIGQAMAPASTITGVFILNAILAEAVARVTAVGKTVDIYSSANAPGTGNSPDDIATRWENRVSGL